MFLHLFVVILDNHQMTCHTLFHVMQPLKIFIVSFKFFWFWSIPSRGRRIFVFHMGNNKKWNQHIGFYFSDMFVYGNEFQHLEIEFKPKILVIPYLSIKKSIQKRIQ